MPTRIHIYRRAHTATDERHVLPDERPLLYSVARYYVRQASQPGEAKGDTAMTIAILTLCALASIPLSAPFRAIARNLEN